jgi:CHASE3 domain sensor protein
LEKEKDLQEKEEEGHQMEKDIQQQGQVTDGIIPGRRKNPAEKVEAPVEKDAAEMLTKKKYLMDIRRRRTGRLHTMTMKETEAATETLHRWKRRRI